MGRWIASCFALGAAMGVFAQGAQQAPTGVWIDARQYDLFHVMLPENASEDLRYAADIFARYWEQSTHHKAEISSTSTGFINVWLGPELVSRDFLSASELEELGPEDYIIRTFSPSTRYRAQGVREHLIICGKDDRATMYGVFAFLRQGLGLRWFAPGLVHVPNARYTLAPVLVNHKQRFAHSDIGLHRLIQVSGGHSEAEWLEYRRAHALPDTLLARRFEAFSPYNLLGPLNGSEAFAHTADASAMRFENTRLPNEVRKGAKEAPAIFPCLIHPAFADALAARIKALVTAEPEALSETDRALRDGLIQTFDDSDDITLSASTFEGLPICSCCSDLASKEESPAAGLLTLANNLAERFAQDEAMPRKGVHLLLYGGLCSTPKTLKPHHNVVVELSTLGTSVVETIERGSFEPNAQFRRDLAAWSHLTPRLYVLDYAGHILNRVIPLPNLGILQDNLHTYDQSEVAGVYYAAPWQDSAGFAEFDYLKAYLLASLLEDPDIVMDEAIEEFLAHFYGPAASAVEEYTVLLDDAVAKSKLPVDVCGFPAWLDGETVVQGSKLMEKAMAGIEDKAIALRLRRLKASLDFFNLASTLKCAPPAEALSAYLGAMRELGVKEPELTSFHPVDELVELPPCDAIVGEEKPLQ